MKGSSTAWNSERSDVRSRTPYALCGQGPFIALCLRHVPDRAAVALLLCRSLLGRLERAALPSMIGFAEEASSALLARLWTGSVSPTRTPSAPPLPMPSRHPRRTGPSRRLGWRQVPARRGSRPGSAVRSSSRASAWRRSAALLTRIAGLPKATISSALAKLRANRLLRRNQGFACRPYERDEQCVDLRLLERMCLRHVDLEEIGEGRDPQRQALIGRIGQRQP